MSNQRTLLTNASWIGTGSKPDKQGSHYDFALLDADSILLAGDLVEWVGKKKDYPHSFPEKVIDLEGRGISPGLIDFHSHPVFAATREEEFDLRTRGASYTEIAEAGGGILNSVRRVRETSKDDLAQHASKYLNSALMHGTTTLEAKSGYGLQPDAEYKLLEVIQQLNHVLPVDLVPTFLGAHEFPAEYKSDHQAYIKLLTEEMIPYVSENKLAAACDIFCETGVFSLDEARQVMNAAKANGLAIKFHADQLTPLGGTRLAAELGALSADHIEFIDEEGVDALAQSGTVAGLLPVAAHFLRMKEDPPVRDMIKKGVICALATDFNPGSAMCENMQMALHLAVIRFRISAAEALWMATAGSAIALGLNDRGWIGEDALADLVIWDAGNFQLLPYHFGVNQAAAVIKRGKFVVDHNRLCQ